MTHFKPTRGSLNPKDKLHIQEKMTRDNDEKYTRNSREDMMLELIDNKRAVEKLVNWVDKLQNAKTDVQSFFGGLAPEVAIELAAMIFNPKTSEKTKLAAVQDLLDRAGHGKVQKHALATVDASTSKEAILSLISGKAGKIPDIEIIDDDEPEDNT